MKFKALIVGFLICTAGISGQDEIFVTGFEPSYTVGGDITGLNSLGETIQISLNGNLQTTVSQDGTFASTDTIEAGQAYLVSIDNNNCTVTNESGIMPYNNVTDVNINCPLAFVTVYDIKQGIATGDVALQNMLVTACGDSGYNVQTIEANPDFNGTDYSAVYVFDNTVDCNLLQVGDLVDLNPATVADFFGEIQLQNATYAIQSTGNQLPSPVITTPAALNTVGVHPLNAVLVEVQNVTVTNPDLGFGEFEVDGELVIDDRFYAPAPAVTMNESMDYIRGPLAYTFDTNKIEPRNASDLGRQTKLFINEVDYDQPGTDMNEFVEIYNPSLVAVDLSLVDVVMVNGSNNTEYNRFTLSGTLNPGEFAVLGSPGLTIPPGVIYIDAGITNLLQNGGPDGIALIDNVNNVLIDSLSYEGAINDAIITGFANPVDLVEGTATSAVDSTDGAIIRFPDGANTGDDNSDYIFSATPTPGAPNSLP